MTDKSLRLACASFGEGEAIPSRYTCDGDNINPPLDITGVPENTQTLVLIVDDPDAPVGTFTHWVVFDIPADNKRIEEGSVPGTQARNDFGKTSYGGPCPPSGTHRYFFRVFALDASLQFPEGVARQDVEKAMGGHVIAEGALMGRYQRKA